MKSEFVGFLCTAKLYVHTSKKTYEFSTMVVFPENLESSVAIKGQVTRDKISKYWPERCFLAVGPCSDKGLT